MHRLFGAFLPLLVVLLLLPKVALLAETPPDPASIHADSVTLVAPAAAKPSLKGLDRFIAEMLREWKVPGLAIAVVQDGEVILAKGYGYRDWEKRLPVTPQTLFAIGSITKSFTVTAMGMLVDEGKLDWDKPVRRYLQNFELHDPVATERVTPRDLVTHRSGLPRHDFLWLNSAFTREEMIGRLRYLEPNKDLRATFQYNNLLFMTAGYLVGQLSELTWEALVQEKIFQPLGMRSSNFSVRDSERSADFALPYSREKEEVKQVPFRVLDQVGPAGSINSNVEEMIRYVQLQVNRGKWGEVQLLVENNCQEMQTPQMVIPGAIEHDELGHVSYGMGWFIEAYQGQKVVQHAGGIDGFISLLSFMPRQKVGMIILTNLSGKNLPEGNPVPTIVSRYIYDRLLGLEPIAWSQRFREQQKKQKEAEEKAKKKGFTRKEGTRASRELRDYAGEYEHPGYGIARVTLEENGLTLTFNSFVSPLQHFHYDVFEVVEDPLNPLEKMKVMFVSNVQGDIDSLRLPLEPTVEEIAFKRRPERR